MTGEPARKIKSMFSDTFKTKGILILSFPLNFSRLFKTVCGYDPFFSRVSVLV